MFRPGRSFIALVLALAMLLSYAPPAGAIGWAQIPGEMTPVGGAELEAKVFFLAPTFDSDGNVTGYTPIEEAEAVGVDPLHYVIRLTLPSATALSERYSGSHWRVGDTVPVTIKYENIAGKLAETLYVPLSGQTRTFWYDGAAFVEEASVSSDGCVLTARRRYDRDSAIACSIDLLPALSGVSVGECLTPERIIIQSDGPLMDAYRLKSDCASADAVLLMEGVDTVAGLYILPHGASDASAEAALSMAMPQTTLYRWGLSGNLFTPEGGDPATQYPAFTRVPLEAGACVRSSGTLTLQNGLLGVEDYETPITASMWSTWVNSSGQTAGATIANSSALFVRGEGGAYVQATPGNWNADGLTSSDGNLFCRGTQNRTQTPYTTDITDTGIYAAYGASYKQYTAPSPFLYGNVYFAQAGERPKIFAVASNGYVECDTPDGAYWNATAHVLGLLGLTYEAAMAGTVLSDGTFLRLDPTAASLEEVRLGGAYAVAPKEYLRHKPCSNCDAVDLTGYAITAEASSVGVFFAVENNGRISAMYAFDTDNGAAAPVASDASVINYTPLYGWQKRGVNDFAIAPLPAQSKLHQSGTSYYNTGDSSGWAEFVQANPQQFDVQNNLLLAGFADWYGVFTRAADGTTYERVTPGSDVAVNLRAYPYAFETYNDPAYPPVTADPMPHQTLNASVYRYTSPWRFYGDQRAVAPAYSGMLLHKMTDADTVAGDTPDRAYRNVALYALAQLGLTYADVSERTLTLDDAWFLNAFGEGEIATSRAVWAAQTEPVRLSAPSNGLLQGGNMRLRAVLSPANSSARILWSLTAGEGKARIDSTGLLTAIASSGTVTVRAARSDTGAYAETAIALHPACGKCCGEAGRHAGTFSGQEACVDGTGNLHVCWANFPDANFREYIEQDVARDSFISVDTAAHINGLYCPARGIASVEGVAFFPALEVLGCENNRLTALDVSNNPALVSLNVFNNRLAALDVSNNPALGVLTCSQNQLTALDISNNPALKTLHGWQNRLTALDVSSNGALVALDVSNNNLTALDVSHSPDLQRLSCSNNPIGSLNISANTALTQLHCESSGLLTLDVSHNPALEYLACTRNNLSALSVSANPALKSLICDKNQLQTLDVSHNPALEDLSCNMNQLTALDVSHNPALIRLFCWVNQIPALDVTGSPALTDLNCANNRLTALDVSHNPALVNLVSANNPITALNVSSNGALVSLDCANNALTALDVTHNGALTSLCCGYNKIAELDVSHNVQLQNLFCTGNALCMLELAANTALLPGMPPAALQQSIRQTLSAVSLGGGRYAVDLFALPGMTAEKLANVTVTDGGVLESSSGRVLYSGKKPTLCRYTYDTHLANNQAARYMPVTVELGPTGPVRVCAPSDGLFYGASVQLEAWLTPANSSARVQWSLAEGGSAAELTQTGVLTALASSGTVTVRATRMDTGETGEMTFYFYPMLSKCCGEPGHHAGLFNGSPACMDGDGCLHICMANFPDVNFRAYIEDELSHMAVNYLTAEEVAAVTAITCSLGYDIRSLTGVAFFTAVTRLRCAFNSLTTLDVSALTALQDLMCNGNQLTALNVSHNTVLDVLDCSDNQLTSLDVSHNAALAYLNCAYNQLTALDISHNAELESLYCDSNGLMSLDVSANPALQSLQCQSNGLVTLDLSANGALDIVSSNVSYQTSDGALPVIDLGGGYWYVSLLALPGMTLEKLANVAMTDGGTLDRTNGGVTYAGAMPTTCSYTYDTKPGGNAGALLMPVTLCVAQTAGSPVAVTAPSSGLICGNTMQLRAVTTPSESGAMFWWSLTSGEGLAKLDNFGRLTAIASSGTVTVRATRTRDRAYGEWVVTLYPLLSKCCGAAGQHAGTVNGSEACVDGAGKLHLCFVNFPDTYFRRRVHGMTSVQNDHIDPEVVATTVQLYCVGHLVTDFTGMEFFTGLEEFYCFNNQIASLDLSKNTALKRLDCSNNYLGSINVSQNAALETLVCYDNQLAALDVSANTALRQLECYNNRLTALDVSANTALRQLECYNNQLTALDVSANAALTRLNCNRNRLAVLDVSANRALTWLNCYINPLTTLDVSHNPALESLMCDSTGLIALDVSHNPALESLSCGSNGLVTLDLAANEELDAALCYVSNQTSDRALPVINLGGGRWYVSLLALPGITLDSIVNVTMMDGGVLNRTNGGVTYTGAIPTTCRYTYDTWLGGRAGVLAMPVTVSVAQTAGSPVAVIAPSDGLLCGDSMRLRAVITPSEPGASLLWSLTSGAERAALDPTGLLTAIASSGTVTVRATRTRDGAYGEWVVTLYPLLSKCCGVAGHQAGTVNGHEACVDGEGKLHLCFANFPDANFRRCVQGIAGVQNGHITPEAAAAAASLQCTGRQIKSLKGVAFFTGLEELFCANNGLSALDVSQNTALKRLFCSNNPLGRIDVSHNAALEILECGGNGLRTLDVSANAALRGLNCWNNSLTAIDVSHNAQLTSLRIESNGILALDVSHNPALIMLNCFYNGLSTVDVSQNPALEVLSCENNRLTALDVTHNPALLELSLSNNAISALDVSHNPALEYLSCFNNTLTTVDVSHNPALKEFFCGKNALASLNVTQNPALESLGCEGAGLTALDVTQNPALATLNCYNNRLRELDVSHNPLLEQLQCQSNGLVSLDLSQNPALERAYSRLFNQQAEEQPVVQMANGSYFVELLSLPGMTREKLANVTLTDGGALQLAAGGALYTGVQPISCRYTYDTKFTNGAFPLSVTVPLSAAAQSPVRVLAPSDGLVIGGSLQLEAALTPPDASVSIRWTLTAGEGLVTLDANGLLTALASSGTVTVRAARTAQEYGEKTFTLYPLRTKCCGEAGHHAGTFHGQAACVNEAGELHLCFANFPDANFRAFVGTLAGGADGHMSAAEATAIRWMYCEYRNIRSMTGLEFFPALITLRCMVNPLTTLDVSHNPALRQLECCRCNLTALDVSHNPALYWLECYNNQLTALDVTQNPALEYLNCYENQLTALNVSANTALTQLTCSYNQLAALDVSANTALTRLDCGSNRRLAALDVSANTALTRLACDRNRLTALNVSANTALRELLCDVNNLTTLDVSANTALQLLVCSNNGLTALDVSHNAALTQLTCSVNKLYALELGSNGRLDAGKSDIRYQYLYDDLPVTQLEEALWSIELMDTPGMTAEKLARITMTDTGVLDSATGTVTYQGAMPTQCRYSYDTRLKGQSGLLGLPVTQTLADTPLAVVPVRSITLTGSDAAMCGEQVQLTAAVYPPLATNKKLIWSIPSGGQLAAVNQTGLVKTTAAGQLTVRAAADDGSGVYAEKTITVTPVKLARFALTGGEFVASGGTLQLSVSNFAPANAENQRVRYAIVPSDGATGTATIDAQTGLLTGGAPGLIKVRATAMDGGGAFAEKRVTVVAGGVSITSETGGAVVYAGKKLTLNAEILPANLTNTKMVWSIAEADRAYLYLAPAGFSVKLSAQPVTEAHTVTVTATPTDGVTKAGTFTVTVRPYITGVSLVRDTEALEYETVTGQTLPLNLAGTPNTLQLRLLVFPEGAEPTITWKTSEPNIVTVSDGLVYARGAGMATVTATAINDAGLSRSASCRIKVANLSRVVEISGSASMRAGDRQQLSARVYADDAKTVPAANSQVTWSLREADKAYATISAAGLLTSRALVEESVWVQVTAAAKDGQASGVFSVELMPPTSRVQLFDSSGADVTGQTVYLPFPPDADEVSADFSARALPAAAAQNLFWQLNAGMAWGQPAADIHNAGAPIGSGCAPSGGNVTLTAYRPCTVTLYANNIEGNGARKSGFIKVVFQTLAEGVTVTQANNITEAAPGQLVPLRASLTPAGLRTGVTWSLSEEDQAYASVSAAGAVYIHPDVNVRRTIRVTARAEDIGGAEGYYDLTITPQDGVLQLRYNGEDVSGETIYVDLTGKTEEQVDLSAYAYSVLLDRTLAKQATWMSSNRAFPIAPAHPAFSETGVVTVSDVGVTTVTAICGIHTAWVQIRASRLAESVTVSTYTPGASAALAAGRSLRLKADVLPATTVNKRVSWSLRPEDAAYASINAAGVMSAKRTVLAPVTVQARATTMDGSNLISEPFTLTIRPAVSRIFIYRDGYYNVTGQLREINITDAPEVFFNAEALPLLAAQAFTWRVSDPRVAQISQTSSDGVLLRPLAPGTVFLSAQATDGSSRAAMVRLRFLQRAMELSIESKTGVFEVASERTLSLYADFGAYTPTDARVRWKVSAEDASYANISPTGILTGKKVTGEKRITVIAEARDGSGLVATREILVRPVVTKMHLYCGDNKVTSKTLTLREGQTLTLAAVATPSAASQSVSWYSGKPSVASLSVDVANDTITVTGERAGYSTYVRAGALDGSGQSARVKIRVTE